MVESAAINKSLFVLAQCVEAISKKQSRIPYRESKMTRILSLGQNNGLCLMILNLAPVRSYHLDTLSSLNFANRTKKIEVREIENEPIVKQAKGLSMTGSIGGTNIQRQPLRPLTSAHNANLHDLAKAEKPVKAFSVYSDNRKALRPSNISSNTMHSNKRTAENDGSRLAKSAKHSDARFGRAASQNLGLSASDIEAMIEAKLSEKLAEKALSDANVKRAAPLSTDLQRRLDALEQRIEASEDKTREEGLHYLLMAKQHQARGEDNSALTMLQLAAPYFPSNQKLERKIIALREKIQAKKNPPQRERESIPAVSLPKPAPQPTSAPIAAPPLFSVSLVASKAAHKAPPPKVCRDEVENEDDSFVPEADESHFGGQDSDCDWRSDEFSLPKRKTTKPASKPKLAVFRDLASSNNSTLSAADDTFNTGQLTPRTSNLLKIINTKDASQIRGLKGVGAKKAEAIVNCLLELEHAEITDLDGLARLKGVGMKGVENMRAGLSVMRGVEV